MIIDEFTREALAREDERIAESPAATEMPEISVSSEPVSTMTRLSANPVHRSYERADNPIDHCTP